MQIEFCYFYYLEHCAIRKKNSLLMFLYCSSFSMKEIIALIVNFKKRSSSACSSSVMNDFDKT
ncbi:hypothetical protein T01_3847 [Trichinella spiralis]|uniref:Uncharacterized protein n=1 Tax=Trichinella spiralis TaxID=6334 RepID=A0A0V1B8X0_TRISP|nr:hypothetical protein T01_3847 [Trichinella spiralis]